MYTIENKTCNHMRQSINIHHSVQNAGQVKYINVNAKCKGISVSKPDWLVKNTNTYNATKSLPTKFWQEQHHKKHSKTEKHRKGSRGKRIWYTTGTAQHNRRALTTHYTWTACAIGSSNSNEPWSLNAKIIQRITLRTSNQYKENIAPQRRQH